MSTTIHSLLIALALASLGPFPASGASPAYSIKIDTSKTSEPISKYIYSQFIEHLGRCIYGGIWAEMLEDRKFYYAVDAEGSPWRSVGSDAVEMIQENPFAGDHTPRIRAGKGIEHGELGVVSGRRYTGYVWLKSENGTAVANVTLRWAQGVSGSETVTIGPVAREYRQYPLAFTAGARTDEARLLVEVEGGDCDLGTLSLMPADNVDGMRPDTLALLKELNAPMYRWPGGNFVSGYDWRDGIGERDRRPPRKNPAWKGVEHNDFGLDEFLRFCREINTEPMVVVNTGFGDAYSAAQEVEYVNGSTDTTGGKWRAENGHPSPYQVKWWGVGNEMFGPWQLGYMSLRHYTLKHNDVVRYMRAVDPSIQLVGVGAYGRVQKEFKEERGWSEGMLAECADSMDLISEHFYCRDELDDVASHMRQLADRIKEKAEGHRALRKKLPNLAGKDIRIAMDEWNYWYRPYVYGELGCIYRLRDALGVAAGLHEYYRNTDIISMAHYAQTVNVIGCIKTSKTEAQWSTTGLPLKLYRNEFGELPVAVEGSFAPLDVSAALTTERKALTLAIINPLSEEATIRLTLSGTALAGSATKWEITGPQPVSFNEPGKERTVDLTTVPNIGVKDSVSAGPFSVTLYKMPLK